MRGEECQDDESTKEEESLKVIESGRNFSNFKKYEETVKSSL